jgi:hypothetical protein
LLPILDLLFLTNAFLVCRQQFAIEVVKLFLHEHLGLVGQVAQSIVFDLDCKFVLADL